MGMAVPDGVKGSVQHDIVVQYEGLLTYHQYYLLHVR